MGYIEQEDITAIIVKLDSGQQTEELEIAQRGIDGAQTTEVGKRRKVGMGIWWIKDKLLSYSISRPA